MSKETSGTNPNFDELLKALNVASDTAAEVPDGEDGEGDGEGEADDAKIAAAAAAAAGEDGGKGALTKSLTVKDADGNELEAVDATDLIKSLMERQEGTESVLAKALETFTGALNKQGDLIKSLNAKVAELSGAGRGRKAVLSVNEKPDVGTALVKSDAANSGGITPTEFFAKANTMFDAGKLSGKDLNTISVCIRGNHPIDQSLISKVASAA